MASVTDVLYEEVLQLRRSESMLRAQYMAFPVPTCSFRRAEGGFVLVDSNRAARALFGARVTAGFARKACEVFVELPDVASDLLSCLNEHQPPQREIVCPLPDGSEGEFRITYVFVPPDVVMLHAEDVTGLKKQNAERAHAMARVMAAEGKYAQLVELLPAVVYLAEPGGAGRWHFVSRRLESLLGYGVVEWMSDPGLWSRSVHPDDRERVLDAEAELAERDEGVLDIQYRIRARDGQFVWVRDRATLLTRPEFDGPVLQGLFIDVSEEKRLHEQLLRVQKMEALGRIAGGIAHDFNNVLSVIVNCAEFARTEDDDDQQLEDILEIENAAKRGADLVRQLLAFARRGVSEKTLVDINELITSMSQMIRRLLGDHITLELDLDKRRATAYIDESQLEQILLNLAVNARDAMPQGGTLSISTSVLRSSEGEDGKKESTRIVVRDSGVGISPADLTHIFEPFFSTKHRTEGTGLGLASVYGIVKAAGGEIDVSSEVGEGTCFSIEIPTASRANSAPSSDASTYPVEVGVGGSRSVLIVEDQEAVRRTTARILERQGYEVVVASDGNEALDRLFERNGAIDIVIADAVMPQMGGHELLARIGELRIGAGLILMSGYDDEESCQKDSGAIDFLPKPFTAQQLLRKIGEVRP